MIMKKTPVILDTDIGDDIDDALALVFALRCEEIRLLGVTTVMGHTKEKAQMASSLLQAAGFPDIPVFAGCSEQLGQENRGMQFPCQYVEEIMRQIPVNREHAVDFMIRTAMNAEEEITLLAIGPLTNIAVALMKEPELKKRIKRIVLMGGAYYFHFVEWNIYCDPEAANIVFQSGIPLTAVGLDVTKKCVMTDEHLERLQSGTGDPVIGLLWKLIAQWQAKTGRRYPILHDALAVYAVFGQAYLQLEKEAVSVELSGRFTRGMTFNRTDRNREEQLVQQACGEAEQSVIHVARQVDQEAFLSFFLDRLLASPKR